jgi:hypothetical protein
MAVYNSDCYIPLEMLDLIAVVDVKAYRAMLAIPLFVRSLTPGKIVDFMIGFGYSVAITKDDIEWRLNGELHRVDGPAAEYANRNKIWCLNGELHRQDGPAVEYADGYKAWWFNGKLHRSSGNLKLVSGGGQAVGSAIEHANGDKEWYVNGKRHRVDGPAIVYTDGYKAWYVNGKRHRVDGPAIEHVGDDKSWYVDGIKQPDQ